MILVLIGWILIFFIFSITGLTFVEVLRKTNVIKTNDYLHVTIDEFFFAGFMIMSIATGVLSIIIPLNGKVLFYICALTALFSLLFFREIAFNLKKAFKSITGLKRTWMFLLFLLILFILSSVVQKITFSDTQTYHAQSIQWIQKYSVVPGLGNLHDRFAFNSMFFVISAVFTFQIKDILIYPLNGICYIVLIIKLFTLFRREFNDGTRWKAVFYFLTLFISLLILIPNLNTPSPDVICGIIISYIFVLLLDNAGEVNYFQFILLNLMIFECISFKISSLFLSATILLSLNKETFKRSLISVIICIIVISPFIIRNYYLSGYLIYPFPAIDIFNTDWKIPLKNVIETKSVIEGWAKIPVISYTEVLNMKISEWIIPWIKQMNFNNKLLLTVNFFSIVTFLIMLIRKEYLLAMMQLVILVSLVFWFIKAPDPRFAYGFIFIGFSLTLAFLVRLIEGSSLNINLKYLNWVLIAVVLVVVSRRIMLPVDTLRNPDLWIQPAPFGIAETRDYYTNFHYRVPTNESGCLNVDIPCTVYPFTNVFMRGEDLQEGFKFVVSNP
jgi:hypothetical protein